MGIIDEACLVFLVSRPKPGSGLKTARVQVLARLRSAQRSISTATTEYGAGTSYERSPEN